jgi:hypothetical protein
MSIAVTKCQFSAGVKIFWKNFARKKISLVAFLVRMEPGILFSEFFFSTEHLFTGNPFSEFLFTGSAFSNSGPAPRTARVFSLRECSAPGAQFSYTGRAFSEFRPAQPGQTSSVLICSVRA